MVGAARIVPEWKSLKAQICQKLQMTKELPEPARGLPMVLSDRPSIVYQTSRHPYLMPHICFYPTATTNVFVCFSGGGPGVKQHQARVWLQPVKDGRPVVEKEVPIALRVKVLQVSHVPSLHLLATYCDDLHLRLFGDHSQGLRLLAACRSPHSITSMCYNPATGELVTGAVGCLTVWAVRPGSAPGLDVAWRAPVAGGEFVQGLSVEREAQVLVALCENTVRFYDYQRRVETRALQLSWGPSLTCCSAHWPQGHLYVGDQAGHVTLWRLETGRQERQFQAHLSTVTSLVCRPAVRTLVTASLDGLLKEWGLGTCQLLRRLDVGEPLLQLHFVGEATFYCRARHSFAIYTLRNFYQLFSAAGSGVGRLARVPCGPGRARILAATEDGVIRFLSPVTGELLFLSWPFHVLERALDYAYDPGREELVVTVGTADVYVLDTTTCPSPAKYILQTTENKDDRVLCLAFCPLAAPLGGLVFSGHQSGHVRLVSQHACRLAEHRVHRGGVSALCSLSACEDLPRPALESSLLCSYGADERVVLSHVGLAGSDLELRPVVVLPSTGCRIQRLLLLPGYLCALTVENRLRLWRPAALVPKKINPCWLETCPLHACPITSLDYCAPLRLLLTGGADGAVRLWEVTGALLVEFDTSLTFSRVCFANPRGDLLVCCSPNIYFISCLECLPRGHLQALAARRVEDDVVEDPLPFLPSFLLSFEKLFVPRYLGAGATSKRYQGMEALTSHRELVLVQSGPKVVTTAKTEAGASPVPEVPPVAPPAPSGTPELAWHSRTTRTPSKRPQPCPAEPPGGEVAPASMESAPLLKKHFLSGGTWLIAPDGYVPNSVIRAQLWPLGTSPHLPCALETTARRRLPLRKPVRVPAPARWWEQERKGKAMRKPQDQPTSLGEPELPWDLLAEIVAQDWLRHKPNVVTLESVTRAVLGQADAAQLAGYSLCTAALVRICQAYVLPAQLRAEAAARLHQGTASASAQVRLLAWQTLAETELLGHRDVVLLAQALLDQDRQVRDQARLLMASIAGITDKCGLRKAIQRQATAVKEQPPGTLAGMVVPEAEAPGWAPAPLSRTELETLLGQVESRLTEALHLVEEQLEPGAGSQGPSPAWPEGAELLKEEESSAETRPQAKRLQVFVKTKLARRAGAPGTRKKSHTQDKLPRIQAEALASPVPVVVPSGEGPGPCSEPETPQGPSATPSGVLPKVKQLRVGQQLGGPRRDTGTRSYHEMLKRQMLQGRWEDEAPSMQPRQPSAQAVGPAPSDPFLIDPGQQYGAQGAAWRDDLCQLLSLRVAPSAENRSALEEVLASTRLALGRRASPSGLGASSSAVLRDLPKGYSAAKAVVARLAERVWDAGGQEQGAPAAGGQEQGAPAAGGQEQGAPAEEGQEQGAPAEEGQEQGAPEEEQARGSPGAAAGGVEGQVWQQIRPLLEILADPAKLQRADLSELLGQLQALGQGPSVAQRVALQATLAMAAQVLAEEDPSLGRAASLCALLASRPPEAAPGAEPSEPSPARELLASAQARLQASAENMAREWAWWEEGAGPGRPSLEPAAPGEDEEVGPKAQWRPARRARQEQLPQAGGPDPQQEAGPAAGPQEKVDWYPPGWLPPAGAKKGAAWLPGEEKLLALYQVLVDLQQRHGSNSPAWWEQFHRLARFYGLQQPLSCALIQQLGAAARRASQPPPGPPQPARETPGQAPATLGQRILCQILPRGPRKLAEPPAFCGVVPLSYQHNVHTLQPLGAAQYGALALSWRAAGRGRQGRPPKLHLGVG
ncbi:WD repeat-containing protein 87 [Pelodiscus sinensis]|uniref:WD repeat-containing protein 87 n=1 Tax=Pelodiscus sinensis TaxID=13735 RepID=UPI003F6C3BE4